MDSYTLFELNQFIRRFVSLNVPEAVWITAEISQASFTKAHCYIDLVQKSEADNDVKAHAQAIIWKDRLNKLQSKTNTDIKDIIKQGIEVKLKIIVDFNERYGLKLIIEDIDENYTLGKLAVEKAETLKRLKSEQLIDKNAALQFPPIFRKIAVISSSQAAGYKDFVAHIENNDFGYRFKLLLFATAVQGQAVEQGFQDAFEDISFHDNFDCVVIIRGGGSKLDLAGFDNYEVCKAVANCQLPVLVGVGHQIDSSLVDMVAKSSLKTPTAVADFIISHNMAFEAKLLGLGVEINKISKNLLKQKMLEISAINNIILSSAKAKISSSKMLLDHIEQNIKQTIKHLMRQSINKLEHIEKTLEIMDVSNTLKRGFSITRKDGKVLKDRNDIKIGDLLETEFISGTIQSEVKNNNHGKKNG